MGEIWRRAATVAGVGGTGWIAYNHWRNSYSVGRMLRAVHDYAEEGGDPGPNGEYARETMRAILDAIAALISIESGTSFYDGTPLPTGTMPEDPERSRFWPDFFQNRRTTQDALDNPLSFNPFAATAAYADEGDYNSASSYSHASQVPPPHADPLVIDLNRDGKTEVGGIRFFDLDADGKRELTAWASGGDGVLVFDKNGNGVIDDGKGGKEFFLGGSYFLSKLNLAN